MNNDELKAAMEDYVARRDIHAAIMAYHRGQDRLQPELMRSAFHDGAYVDVGPFAGDPDTFVEGVQAACAACDVTHHQVGQVDLRVNGDKAYGEVYLIAYHRLTIDGEKCDMIFGGRYVDEYEKRDGRWAIVKRREIADWTRTVAPADSWLEMDPSYHRPGRGDEDFSTKRNWPV